MEPKETKKGKAAGEKTPRRRAEEDAAVLRRQGRGEILSDILGSYTGTPGGGRVPAEDADDL